jgi:hypothetical protein
MPPETPLAFGLHPNAEIGFKLREAEAFCGSLVALQPAEGGGGGGLGVEEAAKMVRFRVAGGADRPAADAALLAARAGTRAPAWRSHTRPPAPRGRCWTTSGTGCRSGLTWRTSGGASTSSRPT